MAIVSVDALPDISADQLRRRSVGNLLRMGHCAPTVMRTMLDASDTDAPWLVLLMAGLPGGIGNTGGECGGLTAPLALLGLRFGRDGISDGLPVAVDKGHELLRRFTTRCGTTECRVIRGNARVPLRCIGVVRQAPAMCAQCLAASAGEVEDSRRRVARMIATMAVGGNAMADGVNAFNRAMNRGHDLARWFEEQFGSTQCRQLTGCDFATPQGVHAYVEHDGTAECAGIAERVAARVDEIVAGAGPEPQQREGT